MLIKFKDIFADLSFYLTLFSSWTFQEVTFLLLITSKAELKTCSLKENKTLIVEWK